VSARVGALFFLSGAAALAFETLWFHQAGLALGSSVMASSLVLAAFMAGLAAGNALAARYGDRIAQPLRGFALLEAIVGVAGFALVVGLPALGPALAPLFAALGEAGPGIAAARFATAFALLVIPTTAMGLSLPLLTRALTRRAADYGPALGRLYGWNTLGAVAGVALAEGVGIGALGIRGTGAVAALLNGIAAAGALRLSRRAETAAAARASDDRADAAPTRARWRSGDWQLAAFAQGFALLALEVVIFRFLSLFVITRSVAFAAMLGVALAGIGLGGLVGELSLRRWPRAHRLCAAAALAGGIAVVAGYASFPAVSASLGATKLIGAASVVGLCLPLLLPVSLLSGVLFTWLGAGLREDLLAPARTTGMLSVANTLGSAAGSLAAAFLLLPRLGMEHSLFLLALLYAGIAALLAWRHAARGPAAVLALLFCGAVLLFPFGDMQSHFRRALLAYDVPDDARLYVREGVNETLLWIEIPFLERPYVQRLVTNSFSMSATDVQARRYMKLYVYLPAALHPDLRRALLVSYGVGSTARALADTPGVERIDVVDISRDILDLSSRAFPDPARDPLRDPRVRAHVEDGRYFLETTRQRYDLITGEPPPPMVAGVVDLYTREYFQLVHERLAEGGMFTTWLPLRQLSDASALSILRAFCEVFSDCSLWRGMSFELMLLGTRGAGGPVGESHFRAQWRDPVVLPELQALGFERPEQLGALFIADAPQLRRWISDVPPLVDDRPRRITAPATSLESQNALFTEWLDPRADRARWSRSELADRLFPPALRTGSLPFFEIQHLLDSFGEGIRSDRWSERLTDLRAVLARSSLRTPVLWLLGSDADAQRIIDAAGPGARELPEVQLHLAARALAERDYPSALRWLERAQDSPRTFERAAALRLFTLCQLHRPGEAQALALELAPRLPLGPRTDDLFAFLTRSCGIHPR
jgi:predicted membrane-bound spermidine synthase